jgi:hypothetical protein
MRELETSRAHRAASAGVFMGRAQASTAALALGLAAAAVGCSAIVEKDGKQCETRDDCKVLFGASAPYVCEQDYCVRPACTNDDQCTSEFGIANGICGASGQCELGCGLSAACADNQICQASTRRCVTRECTTSAECPGTSATRSCVEGACVDPTWGCINTPDERPPATQSTATFKLPVTVAVSNAIPPELSVKVCPMPDVDLECVKPIEGAVAVYAPATGIITITGLPQDSVFRLKLDAPASAGLVPTDFYTQRTARDVTDEPGIRMVPATYWPMLSTAEVPPDMSKGSIFATFYDCEGKKAPRVSVTINEQNRRPDTRIAYFSESSQVQSTLTETSASGLANVVNLPTDQNVGLSSFVNSVVMTRFELRLVPGRMANVHILPRTYVKK